MLSDRERNRLRDMRDHIHLANEIVGPADQAAFAADRVKVLAATRCLEIISEASRHLSDDLKARHPSIPWRRTIDAGNFYRHDYRGVSERIIYTTIRTELAEVLAAIEAELGDQPSSP